MIIQQTNTKTATQQMQSRSWFEKETIQDYICISGGRSLLGNGIAGGSKTGSKTNGGLRSAEEKVLETPHPHRRLKSECPPFDADYDLGILGPKSSELGIGNFELILLFHLSFFFFSFFLRIFIFLSFFLFLRFT